MVNTRTPFSWALAFNSRSRPSRSLSVYSLRPSVSTTTALIEFGSFCAFIASAASRVAAYSGVPLSGVRPAMALTIGCRVCASGPTSTRSAVIVSGVGKSVVNAHKPIWSVSVSWLSADVAAFLASSSLDSLPYPDSLAIEPDTSITTSTRAGLRTCVHNSRTSRRTVGPGGFRVIFTPSAMRYGLEVIGGAEVRVREQLLLLGEQQELHEVLRPGLLVRSRP